MITIAKGPFLEGGTEHCVLRLTTRETTLKKINILDINSRFTNSAKLRPLGAKNVLTCWIVLRAHVLTCERALRAYVLTCQGDLHAYVLTCQISLRALVRKCQRALGAYVRQVSTSLACLCTHVSTCLASPHAHLPTCLDSIAWHGLRDQVITSSVLVLMPLFSVLLPLLLKLYILLVRYKISITAFSSVTWVHI